MMLLLLGSTLLGLATQASEPVDLAKVERKIVGEPDYGKASAEYCLLVFGAEAKSRVWLALGGNTLYVDRNGNGDLTEAGESVAGAPDDRAPVDPSTTRFKIAEFIEGKVKAGDFVLTRRGSDGRVWIQLRVGEKRHAWSVDGVLFAKRAADAPIVHLDGALTFNVPSWETLDRGEKGGNMYVLFGTPGLGERTFAAMDYYYSDKRVLQGVALAADMAFPARESGGVPLNVRTVFKIAT